MGFPRLPAQWSGFTRAPWGNIWVGKGFRDRIWGRKQDFRSNLGSETGFGVKFRVREGFLGGHFSDRFPRFWGKKGVGFGVEIPGILGPGPNFLGKSIPGGVKFTGFIDFGRKMSENAPRKVGKYPPFFGVPDPLKDPREKGGKNHLKLG